MCDYLKVKGKKSESIQTVGRSPQKFPHGQQSRKPSDRKAKYKNQGQKDGGLHQELPGKEFGLFSVQQVGCRGCNSGGQDGRNEPLPKPGPQKRSSNKLGGGSYQLHGSDDIPSGVNGKSYGIVNEHQHNKG